MRPPHHILDRRQVHRLAAEHLQAHLKFKDHRRKASAQVLWAMLLAAAARITWLSDACQRLRDAPSDETARQALLATLPDSVTLQRQLNAALAGHLPKMLRKRTQRLAIGSSGLKCEPRALSSSSDLEGSALNHNLIHLIDSCRGRPWPASPSKWTYRQVWRSPLTSATRTATASRSAGPCPNAAAVSAAGTRSGPTSSSRRHPKRSATWPWDSKWVESR